VGIMRGVEGGGGGSGAAVLPVWVPVVDPGILIGRRYPVVAPYMAPYDASQGNKVHLIYTLSESIGARMPFRVFQIL
jgi:hypothetical protein